MPLSLNQVYKVMKSNEDDVFIVFCNITDMEDMTYDVEYCSRPGDPFGLNPTIREWLTANPNVPRLPYEVPLPVPADVDWERDRRIDGGFDFQGVRYQSRAKDRENIAGASTAALSAIVAGAQAGDFFWHGGATPFAWIAEDNSIHEMDAQTVFSFGQAAMAHKQKLIFTARLIKDMDPIPVDFREDPYWV